VGGACDAPPFNRYRRSTLAQNTYRQLAATARGDADAATLDNVRDRCLRAEAAWIAIAERQERVENARAQNRGDALPFPTLGENELEHPEIEPSTV
jgi:hypothetical protein